jgi:ABC-type dipeptide/oligopeptide/nickel transport system ATPase component
VADRVAILLSGRIVEVGAPEAVIAQPLHPYTAVFVKRSLDADARSRPSNPPPSSSGMSMPPPSGDSLLDRHRRRLRLALEGAAPDPRSPSRGCPYVGHCPKEIDRCSTEEPPLAEALPGSGHQVACWRPL